MALTYSGAKGSRGFDELRAELEEIVKSVDEPHRKAALKAGAELIRERASAIAPKRGGTLKTSGIVAGNLTDGYIEIGWTEEAFYGRFLEMGTSKMAPRPHLRPAYEQRKTQVIDAMLEKMKLK